MRLRILGLFAAVALIAACETAPEDSAAGSGTGGTQATTAKQPETTATVAKVPPKTLGPVPGSIGEFELTVGDVVFFDYDKFNLTAQARTTLERQAAWLQIYPSVAIIVEGHCDERGTREYNLALGERRANAVLDYLVSLGVNADRIKTTSFGKERPVALGSNEAAWAQNRRGFTRPISGLSG